MVDDEIEPTLWRILRASTLRVLLHGSGREVSQLSDAEQSTALDAHYRALEATTKQLVAVVERAVAVHGERLRAGLHETPGLDGEMLDQALAFAEAGESG